LKEFLSSFLRWDGKRLNGPARKGNLGTFYFETRKIVKSRMLALIEYSGTIERELLSAKKIIPAATHKSNLFKANKPMH
jgi:hypothetical protein